MELLFREDKHIKLLTQIRRSYNVIWKRLRDEGKVSTPLFTFKDEGRKRFKRTHLRVFSVVVKSTGRKYYVTYSLYFGKADWSLWRTKR
jgi:hypothetical protein